MKKIVDFICGGICVACFLGVIGSAGAFENDAITGGQCIMQAAGFIAVILLLCLINAVFMREAGK